MIFAKDLHISEVDVSQQWQGLLIPSNICIRARKISLQKIAFSSCRAILRTRIKGLDGSRKPYSCGKKYMLGDLHYMDLIAKVH